MLDNKDIYETEDLPEAEQDFEEETKDCVEKLDITVPTAYNRFKGKEILTTPATKQKNTRLGNPFERAKKILSELEALSKDLETNYDNKPISKDEPVTKDQLLVLIEGLSMQIKELDLNKYFGPESSFEVKDPEKVVYNKLMQYIDNLKFDHITESAESKSHNYILTAHTEVNEHLNQIKVVNLLKRLDVVERALGNDSVQLSNIISECPNKGLLEAMERLASKTSILNNQQLNVIESRLVAVANKLQNLTTVASSGTTLNQESELKIAELYSLVKKWDHIVDTVPSMVDQYVSMQDFYMESAKLGQCISYLDARHHEISFKQQTSQMAVKNIQEIMPTNFETMQKNMSIINEKLKSLTA